MTVVNASGSMFQNASNFAIHGGTFIVVSNDEKEKIHKWLNAPDCTINFQAADDKRTKGTGQWILNHPEYIKWKQSSSMLWIQGKAGSGKTILFTTVIRDLKQIAPENIWYHYFDSRDNTDSKSTFRGLYDECNRQGLTASSPATQDLAMVLKEVLETTSGGYIVLDAMDECCETAKVVAWMQSLCEKFFILFTSRYGPGAHVLKRCLTILLENGDALVDEDIAKYLEEEVEECHFRGDLKAEVIDTLKEKAQGQFRWVDCQLRTLKICGSPRVVRKALRNLPKDLIETYSQAMLRTWEREENREDAHHLLLWLTYAFEPLTVRKIADIMTIDLENNCVDGKAGEMEVKIHSIIDSTLVAIDIHSNVQLAHASVKEFIIHKHYSSQTVGLFSINELLAHEKIAQACIIYLMQFTSIGRIQSCWELNDNSLMPYAVEYWPKHAKFVEDSEYQGPLHDMIMEFAKGGKKVSSTG
ncbi:hypothetical protein GYMLUDRAFT_916418 [Collybiopsis luxurians FD-317 M1]|uniref:NACHT domain-containing protein n=1 Tax=Collybiopsis luxurians FD-317 M1 TaxID=944289 RepID=A0A0D0CH03_9AGAR|nr:hypothetical protein GYMLUDRAFT_916418 [Collybiopsis luxurians FD-317 M1]